MNIFASKKKDPAEPAPGYNDLKLYFGHLNTLFSIRSLLASDMMTVMPPGGMARRMQEVRSITKRIYAETAGGTLTQLLERVERAANTNWNAWDAANLKEMRRIYDHMATLTPDMYLAAVNVSSGGRGKHQAALASGDWNAAVPYLEQVVELYREIGARKQKCFKAATPYEGLLLSYAADITEAEIDRLYGALLPPLRGLLQQSLDKQNSLPAPLKLDADFSPADQMGLNRTILELMGFDFNRGALLMSSASPLAGGSPEDVRILVRCGARSTFLDSLGDTLYQGGRGLYLQNLPPAWTSQPVGQDLGTLALNSVSILYETMVGRTPQFFNFVAVRAEGLFRQFHNKSFAPENLYRLRKLITVSARRDDADEFTKIFHDILRYRIERDLINGKLEIADVPARWADESEDLLGIRPASPTEGPLQNPDWFTGRFGFIPTNTCAQIIAAAVQENIFTAHPDWAARIERGDLRFIGQWLAEHICGLGRSVGAMALMETLSDKPLSVRHLISHFERRYLSDKR